MPYENRPTLFSEPGIRFGLGVFALIPAMTALSLLHLDAKTAMATLAVVVAVACVSTTAIAGVGIGVAAWGLYTGFVENDYGALTLTFGDAIRLTILVAAAVLTCMATRPRNRATWEVARSGLADIIGQQHERRRRHR